MRGIVVDLQDADIPVLVVPGGYIAFFPYPRCEHVHETPEEAADCVFKAERFVERPKEWDPPEAEE